ncbi:MAG: HAMP domain-containing sensor histidine kinase [Eubacteriaceae bacterium]
MDIKWKNFSHCTITKVIVFIIVIFCFTGAITTILNMIAVPSQQIDPRIINEDSYYDSEEFTSKINDSVTILTRMIGYYKSEEHILSGGTVTEDLIKSEEVSIYYKYQNKVDYENLDDIEKLELYNESKDDEILQFKEQTIERDLDEYQRMIKKLEEYKGVIYYASDGVNKFTNTSNVSKEFFKSHSCYIVFDKSEESLYPEEITNYNYYTWFTSNLDEVQQQSSSIYISFDDEYLNERIIQWNQDKEFVTKNLYMIAGCLLVFLISFSYLILITGRKSFKDKKLSLNIFDKIYNDINIILCILLITVWFVTIPFLQRNDLSSLIFLITFFIGALGLILVMSIFKHLKNRTFIKHSFTFKFLSIIYKLIKSIYHMQKLELKIVLILLGFPIFIILTHIYYNRYIFYLPRYYIVFFTDIVIAGWLIRLTLKKVKEFSLIKEGIEIIKDGNLNHTIDVSGNGEFGKLAANINSIADGLNKAVENELKSERLKSELITNVSHDIRTPLTSIITYVDLLKTEEDKLKANKYIEIIDQKSQRLKTLTDDLFEASKASSGNIPVNFEKINIVSLINQGMGELNHKIENSKLEFKINNSKNKVFVKADGKLLWRAIENLLSNIFKYAQKGSRVYIDIKEKENEIILIIKNISAYELNISSDELMERFTRGDESRSSEGSGLGLSIAKSFIEIQNGRFKIDIDGDLFKTSIQIPKYKE